MATPNPKRSTPAKPKPKTRPKARPRPVAPPPPPPPPPVVVHVPPVVPIPMPRVRRPPTAAEIAAAARQLEIALGATSEPGGLRNWQTSVLGILAIVASVAGSYLEQIGYQVPNGMVTLIVGLLTGGGLIVASDGRKASTRPDKYRPAEPRPEPQYAGDPDPVDRSR